MSCFYRIKNQNFETKGKIQTKIEVVTVKILLEDGGSPNVPCEITGKSFSGKLKFSGKPYFSDWLTVVIVNKKEDQFTYKLGEGKPDAEGWIELELQNDDGPRGNSGCDPTTGKCKPR